VADGIDCTPQPIVTTLFFLLKTYRPAVILFSSIIRIGALIELVSVGSYRFLFEKYSFLQNRPLPRSFATHLFVSVCSFDAINACCKKHVLLQVAVCYIGEPFCTVPMKHREICGFLINLAYLPSIMQIAFQHRFCFVLWFYDFKRRNFITLILCT
jgi:hypothetical protein